MHVYKCAYTIEMWLSFHKRKNPYFKNTVHYHPQSLQELSTYLYTSLYDKIKMGYNTF